MAAHRRGEPYQERAARLVCWRLTAHHARPASRLLRELLWAKLLPRHLTSAEQLGLYVALSYNGHRYGLSELAQIRYGKRLDQLSVAQAAEAVAVLWAPAYLAAHPDRLASRRDKLLAAVQREP
ncbi:transglycosylase domain-containing protein [Lysobacter claricitrinus]|uniref:transglycosylase domain-containing protein n=1 Tax=Lysobacter claricitrinus TaxID=3367728 RepID=UPI0037DB238E